MKVTVEKVENGFLVTTEDGMVFVSTKLNDNSYSYRSICVADVLKVIFEADEEVEA